MVGRLNISLKRKNILQPVNLIAAGYITIAIVALQNYISFQSPGFILGIIALAFVSEASPVQIRSSRYVWITFGCMVLCFLIPVKTLLFFTICFALIYFKEIFYGKTGLLMPAVVILASPVFQYIAAIFSFPIRMQLTRIAGQIFNSIGHTVEVYGNMIVHGGNEFSVDPACMGLNMMTTSLLMGVTLMAYYQKSFKRKVSDAWILIYLALILLLNIIGNLFRIVLLVQFNILPDTISHDIAGIGCLLVYVFVPATILAGFIAKRSPLCDKENINIDDGSPVFSLKGIKIHLAILAGVALVAFKISTADTFSKFRIPSQEKVPRYKITSYTPGIVKLEDSETLVYIKYIRGFYDTEHNPMICWTGSGYQFEKMKEETIAGRNVLTATLIKSNEKLYSAWWYDNGKRSTTNQFKWRWDLLKGSNHYILVNVTCSTKEELNDEVQKIVNRQTLSPFFEN